MVIMIVYRLWFDVGEAIDLFSHHGEIDEEGGVCTEGVCGALDAACCMDMFVAAKERFFTNTQDQASVRVLVEGLGLKLHREDDRWTCDKEESLVALWCVKHRWRWKTR